MNLPSRSVHFAGVGGSAPTRLSGCRPVVSRAPVCAANDAADLARAVAALQELGSPTNTRRAALDTADTAAFAGKLTPALATDLARVYGAVHPNKATTLAVIAVLLRRAGHYASDKLAYEAQGCSQRAYYKWKACLQDNTPSSPKFYGRARPI